jgi:hypothetical protein
MQHDVGNVGQTAAMETVEAMLIGEVQMDRGRR